MLHQKRTRRKIEVGADLKRGDHNKARPDAIYILSGPINCGNTRPAPSPGSCLSASPRRCSAEAPRVTRISEVRCCNRITHLRVERLLKAASQLTASAWPGQRAAICYWDYTGVDSTQPGRHDCGNDYRLKTHKRDPVSPT